MHFLNRYTFIIIGVAILGLLGALALKVYLAVYGPNESSARGEFAEISITPGMTLQEVALNLQDRGLISSAREFLFSARFLLLDRTVQAGMYPLPYGESNAQLLYRLNHAGANAQHVTIPEGLTCREIASLLRREIDLDSGAFMQAVYDTVLLQRFQIAAPSFEGFLFPDSYNFYYDMRPSWVIQQMVRKFFQVADSVFVNRAAAAGLTLTQAVTLASIIEGEMHNREEASLISAVYHNRLRKKMLLQADPTIQYVIPGPRRRLHRSDLQVNSPYNTYLHPGLPPGPVCRPR